MRDAVRVKGEGDGEWSKDEGEESWGVEGGPGFSGWTVG